MSGGLLSSAVLWVLEFIKIVIFVRIIISWLPISKDNRFMRFLYDITEPFLAPIRGIIERSAIGKNMMVDFSPIVAYMIIWLVESVIRSTFI